MKTASHKFLRLLGMLLVGGAAAPLSAEETDYQEPPITQTERQHWSFQPVVRGKLPEVADAKGWCRGGIDRFILLGLDEKKTPIGDVANRETLLRRLSFDLIGLPPTLEEMEAFTKDESPDAYERLVDRLLASPAYGERWGQHWLDLARFAETDGYEHDLVRKEAWRYRDWAVAALNADMPYDEFVRQQVAGDEQGSGVRSQESEEIASQISNFKSEISDGTKPKQQPLTRNSIPTMFCLSGPDMPDINSQEQRKHELLNEVTGTIGSVFMGLQIGCAQCHDHKYDPLSQADFYRLRAFFEPAVSLQKDVSVTALRSDDKFKGPARLWIRGDWQRPGMEVQPAMVRVLLKASGGREPPDTTSTGDAPKNQGADAPRSPSRTDLARWLTSPTHPLTSRVMPNRLWQHHFGRGIVESPSDFGIMGTAPANPELLDLLASEFMTNGWSIKKLNRQMVCSAAYRQASRKPRRLEGEAIRDAMLAASGQLDFRRNGPGVMPPLPEELTKTLLPNQWKASENPADAARRSIYIFARRTLRYPLFEAFDRPDANASCAVRIRSTTAPQALLMLNSSQTLQMAQHVAGRIDGDHAAEQLILTIFGRQATAAEISRLDTFLKNQSSAPSNPRAAMVQAALALLNSSEMIYLD